ncbi:relA-associated inhibitor-like [Thunnus thynnus]|uniref:relA-associated inhibitor-like n=1 Tax=Thunnus thynnus TaxID=8237 RepID=UPI00352768CB
MPFSKKKMASCVRLLLLSLLAFGQYAKELSYRGSSGIKPYFELAEDFPRSYKPALASSSYARSALPGGSQGSYGPTETTSLESLKPIPAPSAGDYGGSYGRQVNSYSPEGSVSSYRPGLLMAQKPRQTPEQPHYQINPNTNGVLQTKAGMWDLALPQNGDRFESGVVSSYGIEMHSDKPAKPQPQPSPSYPAKPQPQPQPQRSPSYPAKPQPQSISKPIYAYSNLVDAADLIYNLFLTLLEVSVMFLLPYLGN